MSLLPMIHTVVIASPTALHTTVPVAASGTFNPLHGVLCILRSLYFCAIGPRSVCLLAMDTHRTSNCSPKPLYSGIWAATPRWGAQRTSPQHTSHTGPSPCRVDPFQDSSLGAWVHPGTATHSSYPQHVLSFLESRSSAVHVGPAPRNCSTASGCPPAPRRERGRGAATNSRVRWKSTSRGRAVILLVHSPLLGQALLPALPPLSDMLKFSGSLHVRQVTPAGVGPTIRRGSLPASSCCVAVGSPLLLLRQTGRGSHDETSQRQRLRLFRHSAPSPRRGIGHSTAGPCVESSGIIAPCAHQAVAPGVAGTQWFLLSLLALGREDPTRVSSPPRCDLVRARRWLGLGRPAGLGPAPVALRSVRRSCIARYRSVGPCSRPDLGQQQQQQPGIHFAGSHRQADGHGVRRIAPRPCKAGDATACRRRRRRRRLSASLALRLWLGHRPFPLRGFASHNKQPQHQQQTELHGSFVVPIVVVTGRPHRWCGDWDWDCGTGWPPRADDSIRHSGRRGTSLHSAWSASAGRALSRPRDPTRGILARQQSVSRPKGLQL